MEECTPDTSCVVEQCVVQCAQQCCTWYSDLGGTGHPAWPCLAQRPGVMFPTSLVIHTQSHIVTW